MSSITVFSVILILTIFPLVFTSGHLRLEFTSSENKFLRLITDYSNETLQLTMGEKKTSSFHPTNEQDTIRIGLSTLNRDPVFYKFKLENTGQHLRNIFDQDDVVVFIQSVFECDEGFFGSKCLLKKAPSTSTIASKMTSTTTMTTTTTTITTSTESEKQASSKGAGLSMGLEHYNSIIIVVLVIIIITLLILIAVFAVLLFSSRSQNQHIIIAGRKSASKCKKLDFEGFEGKSFERSNDFQYEEPRYTAAPFGSFFSKQSEY
ncbi:SKN-1 Dependent Zygotic transcript [Caenorhabditis elegans]|uniref:SKN-1 Dependent Zygotic transcript n=1 Tax=Caenorhabditis elegans TaxID=6239 RepID=Q22385_CAEEL|nr:SKN-1 Dependent Zygotic transcript [Caenorhabditis elegans]CAA96685.2 SKN-1 Dependent Zygotic transcript [Caenorhabditis elegans]